MPEPMTLSGRLAFLLSLHEKAPDTAKACLVMTVGELRKLSEQLDVDPLHPTYRHRYGKCMRIHENCCHNCARYPREAIGFGQ